MGEVVGNWNSKLKITTKIMIRRNILIPIGTVKEILCRKSYVTEARTHSTCSRKIKLGRIFFLYSTELNRPKLFRSK